MFSLIRPGHPAPHGVVAASGLRGGGPRTVLPRGYGRPRTARHRGRQARLRPLSGGRTSASRGRSPPDRPPVCGAARARRSAPRCSAWSAAGKRREHRKRQGEMHHDRGEEHPVRVCSSGRRGGLAGHSGGSARALAHRQAGPLEHRGPAVPLDPSAARRGRRHGPYVRRHRGRARGDARCAARRPARDGRDDGRPAGPEGGLGPGHRGRRRARRGAGRRPSDGCGSGSPRRTSPTPSPRTC